MNPKYEDPKWWDLNRTDIDEDHRDGSWWVGAATAQDDSGKEIQAGVEGFIEGSSLTIEHVEDVEYA